MLNGRKRTIDELKVKYKRHADFKDLFVEGKKDQDFFRLVFKYLNMGINVYQISTVDVPQKIANILRLELSLYHNNRNKLITLAHSLEDSGSVGVVHQCRCIIDKDFDQFLKKIVSCSILLYTDYNCIELYAFDELCMKKFILSLPNFPISAEELINQLSKVLPILFLIRLTKESLKLRLKWTNFIDNCICKKCEINFNLEQFFIKFYNTNGFNKQNQKIFREEFELNRQKLTDDVRNQIHKDDLRELFIKFIRKCGGVTDLNKNSELNPLFSSIEINELKEEGLLKKLIEWYNI